ncbi:hypothetical protein QTJ16_001453 [Diplocarpon rosae]|uniref:Uncharacterized protein n=1 Tax=Diplocarpon rosae TaxID=946125 RepID=A0AAD9WHI7_9HELO|nr:hypothetical protein QTJ16_001453 [Diplocarpon rosae]
MAPNSRPPLTSRIRASIETRRKSFDGMTYKLSRSGRTSTDGLPAGNNNNLDSPAVLTPDQDVVRSAVDAAINGEAFQNAIAANLARLVKPSIKSALDTIQPVVEAVYTHELLLRKTSQSVEDVLSQMHLNAEAEAGKRERVGDAASALPGVTPDGEAAVSDGSVGARAPGADVEQLRALLEDHCSRTGERVSSLETILESSGAKVGEVAQGMADIQAMLEPTREGVKTLVSSSGETHTTTNALQAQLDQLKTDIASIREAVGTDLSKNVQTLTEKSGAQDVSILAVSEHITKLDMIASDIAALKSHTDTAEKIDSLSNDIVSLKTTVDTSCSSTAENLTTALSSLSEHTSLLGDLKSAPAHPEILSTLKQSSDSHAAALQELTGKVASDGAADHSAALQELKTELEAVKSVVLAHGESVTGLGTKIDGSSAEVLGLLGKADGRVEGCAGVLDEIKGMHGEHAAALEGIKAAGLNAAPADGDINVQIAAIASKLEEHTAVFDQLKGLHGEHSTALEEIKTTGSNAAPTESDINVQIAAIVSKLDEHTAAFGELKGLQSEHSTALESLKSINDDAASADSDISVKIAAVVSKLDEHTAAFGELKGLHGEHSTALENIKPINTEATATDTSSVSVQIADIVNKLDEHTAAFDQLRGLHSEHSTALESIKSVQAEAAHPDPRDISVQIATIASKLDEHAVVLEEVRSSTGSHTTALQAIKSDSPDAGADVGAQVTALAAKLDEHTTALEEIKSSTGSHTTALQAIKSDSPDAGADVGAQVTALAAKLDEHITALEEIKTVSVSHSSVFDELKGLHGSHAAALEGIRSAIPEVVPTADIADVGTRVASIVTKLDEHTAALDDIKGFGAPLDAIKALDGAHASAFEELKTLHTSLSSTLADLKSASADPTPAYETTVTDILTTLETHTAALEEIKGSTSSHAAALASHGTALEGIRSLGGSIPAEGVLESQIAAVVATLGSHSAVLEEIKAHSALLEEIKTSAGVHATALETHGNTLEGIRALGVAPPTEASATEVAEIVAKLDSHSAVLHEIKTSAGVHATALETHGSKLESIKSLVAAPSAEGDAGLANIVARLDAHGAVLDEIKGISGSQSSVLDELKTTHSNHSAALEEIKTATFTQTASAASLTALETQIGSIISTLDCHSSSWNELKALTSSSSSSSPSPDLASILSTLAQHSITLNEIKEDVSAEILTALHDMGQAHAGHATLLSEIREADVSAEVLTLLHTAADERAGLLGKLDGQGEALNAVQEATGRVEEGVKRSETEGSGLATRIEEMHGMMSAIKDSHERYTSSLDEIRSRSDEPVPVPAIDVGSLETQVGILATKLDDQHLVLGAIKDSHDLYTTSLHEIKSRSLEPVPAAGLEGLEGHMTNIVARLDDHGATLSSIRDSHISHTACLNEIKARAVEPASTAAADFTGLETQITGLATKLEDHHVVLAAIKDATADSHAALGEIRSRAIGPAAVSGSHELGEEIAGIATKLDDHTALLTTLRDESGASSELHSAMLSEIRDAALAATETHASHTRVLNEIKDAEASSAVLSEIRDAALASVGSHSAHTTALTELKETALMLTDNSKKHAATLCEMKDATLVANEYHTAHSAAFTELKSLQTPLKSMDLPAQLATITETLHALLAQHHDGREVGEISGSITVQMERNQAVTTAVVDALSEDLKSEIARSEVGILDRFACLENLLRGEGGDGALSKLGTVLEGYGLELKDVATQLSALDGKIEESSKRVSGLCDGVHLSERGLGQMKEDVAPVVLTMSASGTAPSPDEGKSVLPVVAALASGVVAAGILSQHPDKDVEDYIQQPDSVHVNSVSLSQDSKAPEKSAPVELQPVEKSPGVESALEEESTVEGGVMGSEEVLHVLEAVMKGSVDESGVEEAVEPEPTVEEDIPKLDFGVPDFMPSESAEDKACVEKSNDLESVNADADIAENHICEEPVVEKQIAIDSEAGDTPCIEGEVPNSKIAPMEEPEERALSGQETFEREAESTSALKEITISNQGDNNLEPESSGAVVEGEVAVEASFGEVEKKEDEATSQLPVEHESLVEQSLETQGTPDSEADSASAPEYAESDMDVETEAVPVVADRVAAIDNLAEGQQITETSPTGASDPTVEQPVSDADRHIEDGVGKWISEDFPKDKLEQDTHPRAVDTDLVHEGLLSSFEDNAGQKLQELTPEPDGSAKELENAAALDKDPGQDPVGEQGRATSKELQDLSIERGDSTQEPEKQTIEVSRKSPVFEPEADATSGIDGDPFERGAVFEESSVNFFDAIDVQEQGEGKILDGSTVEPALKYGIKDEPIQVKLGPGLEAQLTLHTTQDQNQHSLENEGGGENDIEAMSHTSENPSLEDIVTRETQGDNAEATPAETRHLHADDSSMEDSAEKYGHTIGALDAHEEPENLRTQDETLVKEDNSSSWPFESSAVGTSNSPSMQSPSDTRLGDMQPTSEPLHDLNPIPSLSHNATSVEQLYVAPSFPPVAHQMFQDTDMDSGHATPLDEARSNPFDDSDDMLSPSDALSPQSVLSPEDENGTHSFGQQVSIHSLQPAHDQELQFSRPELDPSPRFQTLSGVTSEQHYASESEDAISPTSEYGPPDYQDQRKGVPIQGLSQASGLEAPAATLSQGQQHAALSRGFEREDLDLSSAQGTCTQQLSGPDDESSLSRRRDFSPSSDSGQQVVAELAYRSGRGGFAEPRRDFLLFSPVGEAPTQTTDDFDVAHSPELERVAPLFPNLGRPVAAQQTHDLRGEQLPGLPLAHAERNVSGAHTYDSEDDQTSELEHGASFFPNFGQPVAVQRTYDLRDEQSHGFQRNYVDFSQTTQRVTTQPTYNSDDDRSPGYRGNIPKFPDLGHETTRESDYDDEPSPEASRDIPDFPAPNPRQKSPMQQYDSDDVHSSDDEWDDSPGSPDPRHGGAMQADYGNSRSPDTSFYRPEPILQGQIQTSRRAFGDSYGGFDTEERLESGTFPNANRRSAVQPEVDAPTRSLDFRSYPSEPLHSPVHSIPAHNQLLEDPNAVFTTEQHFDPPSPRLSSPLRPLGDQNLPSRGFASHPHALQGFPQSRQRISSNRELEDENEENDFRPRDLDAHPHSPPGMVHKTRSLEGQVEDGYRHTASEHDYQGERTGFPDPHFKSPWQPAKHDDIQSRGFTYGDEPSLSSQPQPQPANSYGSLPAHLRLDSVSPPAPFTDLRGGSPRVDGNPSVEDRRLQDSDGYISMNPFQNVSSAAKGQDDKVTVSRNPFRGVGAGEALPTRRESGNIGGSLAEFGFERRGVEGEERGGGERDRIGDGGEGWER